MNMVIKGMAEASKQIAEEEPNPFKEQYGEILPKDVEKNCSGYFVRENLIPYKVNGEKLVAQIAQLKDQILIGKFMGQKPYPCEMESWLQTLNLKHSL